jgi:hypothetical protein
MANKYLGVDGSTGFPKEIEATVTSAGAGDAGEIVALDAAGKLDTSLLPTGIGADTALVAASEDLAAGDFVNIYADSGAKCRKADASGGVAKKADGFVLASVTSGNNATVYFEGTNNQVSGLTAGSQYFLSATPGVATDTPPTTAGHIAQALGKAVSTTAINAEIGDPVIRA